MHDCYIFLFLIFVIRSIRSSQIEIEIPSISKSHLFEISSNVSQLLNRDVLFGLVDGTSSSISSSIIVRASYQQLHVERFFNLYQSNNKNSRQKVQKEPIFRSYLLTSSFNRSYPFIRVLVGSVQGPYANMNIQPLCAIVTAVNEQSLYETQACFISPHTGYCLVTISVLKMVEYVNKNHTKNKIELYLKLHHVVSIDECISDHTPKQDHIHHETRIGHAEYIDNDNIYFSTITRSSISIDYPIGIHYLDWYFPLKLKLIISSSLLPSFVLRCRLLSHFSIHLIQTNILKISNYNIQLNHNVYHRASTSDIDFNIKINQINKTSQINTFEIDLATITLKINSTNIKKINQENFNSVSFIDWFLLSTASFNNTESILRVPIQIKYDDIQTIVGLTDFTSLINTAMLSMQIQQFPLTILAVNHSGSIQSISQAVCHSENIHLIQVDSNCNHIYFSGQERDDFFDQVKNPTSIVIRYEKYLQHLHFTVYIPERPLRIELSDAKLSRINGWFIRKRINANGEQKRRSFTDDFDNDDDGGGDGDDNDDGDDDDDFKCTSVYQQSTIYVYTKFYRTTQNGDRIYLFNKLNVLITPLVRAHLEIDNKSVAIIKNDHIIGIGPGKTNIRIYSFTNKLPMGSKGIYVDDKDFVDIEKISFNLVTDIGIETNLIEHTDPIYKVHFQIKPIFNRFHIDNRDQFGQINIILTYSDNTSVSLDDIPSDYYDLEIDMSRKNPLLITIDSSKPWKNRLIRPLALGHTTIYSRLKLGQQRCTDDRSFPQNELSCEIVILSNNTHQLNGNINNNNNLHSLSHEQSDHYVVLNNNNNNNIDHRTKTSPFLIALSILLGTCIVLFLSFITHWLINFYYRQNPNHHLRRSRHSTHSGAEEVNHDWIFLDRSSLEMPMKQQQQQQQEQQEQQNPPSIHSSTLHITSNPIINTPTLQQQKDLTELTHSQMVAYFESLKESHA
ncbi:unnamed protein product [Rotaria socialis]|uniref:Uncharacterized protein n=1 Tax=Rotaria socialis TaxID=392032 RepID=A0A818UAC5_9BILA|nr:unnamed protein product [Rotaria socialis]CAF4471398.1 unnamed protein product [Rotaria socialis]